MQESLKHKAINIEKKIEYEINENLKKICKEKNIKYEHVPFEEIQKKFIIDYGELVWIKFVLSKTLSDEFDKKIRDEILNDASKLKRRV